MHRGATSTKVTAHRLVRVNEPWFYALWAVGAYVLGSVSVGDMVARAAGVDIRRLGTRNPGTANIFREMGGRYAAGVLAGDVIKGAAGTVPLLALGLPALGRRPGDCQSARRPFLPHTLAVHRRHGDGRGDGYDAGPAAPWGSRRSGAGCRHDGADPQLGLTGGIFFLLTGVAGGVLHRDWMGVMGVALVGIAVTVKSWYQYRWL